MAIRSNLARHRLYLVLFNAGVGLLLLWSLHSGVYDIRVEVNRSQVTATVDGQVPLLFKHACPGGGIALEMEAPQGFNAWINDTTLPQSWESIRIIGTDGAVLFADDFDTFEPGAGDGSRPQYWVVRDGAPRCDRGRLHGSFKIELSGAEAWSEYIVEARLRRGVDAGLQVLGGDLDRHVDIGFKPFRHNTLTFSELDHDKRLRFSRQVFTPSSRHRIAVLLAKLLVVYFLAIPAALLLAVAGWMITRLRATKTFGGLQAEWLERFHGFVPPAAAIVVVTVCSAIILCMLHGIPHVQDSVAYYFQSKLFAAGKLYGSPPPVPAAFSHQFVVFHGGKVFAQYPFGFPLLLAIGQIMGVPWLIPPLLGGLNILLLNGIGKALFDRRTGAFACLLALASPFYLLLHGTFMSHSAGLFFSQLALYFTITADRSRSLGRGVLAGGALAMLAATRPLTTPAIALMAGVWSLCRLRRQRHWWDSHMTGMLAAGIMGLGLLLAYNTALSGNPFTSAYDIEKGGSVAQSDLGPGISFPLSRAFSNVDTLTSLLMGSLFRWPAFLVLAPLCIPFLTMRPARRDLFLALGLAAVMAAWFLYKFAGVCYGPRYYFEAM
ncbi:glycosyltransferase family 39 protein, partial [bacterium]|nr:glycosyltransferase family 39 protein [candidate division CSSED10-310 bacterium]